MLIAAAAAAGGGYLLLRTKGSPQQTAAEFLSGWQRRDYQAMNKVTVGLPHGGVAGPLTAAARQLGVRSTRVTPGTVTSGGGAAQARFTVTERLSSNHTWTYRGMLRLVDKNRRWWVRWSPSVIYPKLKTGERFALSTAWASRAPILAADGTVLSSPAALAQSGSIALLTGYVGPATKKQAKQLGAPYKAGDPIGQGGIEQTYQSRLAGGPSLTIRLTGPGKRDDGVVHKFAAVPGKPVRTSIKMSVQLAASQAVLGASTSKPIDMVVIQPSTGRVLAMVERPGSWDRAIDGLYPPGSTFKIVTASALAKEGMTPSSPVDCPSTVNIGGYTIHNDQNEQLGLDHVAQGIRHLLQHHVRRASGSAADRRQAGRDGQGVRLQRQAGPRRPGPARLLPVAVRLHRPRGRRVRPGHGPGQPAQSGRRGGRRPERHLAAAAAGRQPGTEAEGAPARDQPVDHRHATADDARGRDHRHRGRRRVPAWRLRQDGTAEYGTGKNLHSHGWFIGYDGDLAFAVLVEGGGFGASSAGPIANSFLHQIYG